MNFTEPVEQAFRITPRQKSALARIGIKTVQDVLFHFPSRYESLGGLKQGSKRRKRGRRESALPRAWCAMQPESSALSGSTSPIS